MMNRKTGPQQAMRTAMSVILKLRPETEQLLTEKAARAGQTLEVYLEQLAEREVHAANNARNAGPAPVPADQWVAELRAWAAGHRRLDTLADDSREGIYEGRGE